MLLNLIQAIKKVKNEKNTVKGSFFLVLGPFLQHRIQP